MQSAEAIIDSKLETLRKELAEKEEADRRYWEELAREEEARRKELEDLAKEGIEVSVREMDLMPVEPLERSKQIRDLRTQLQLLEEIKDTLDKQHTEAKAQFLAIEHRDTQSSQQNTRLTVVSSILSLIAGWLLSLIAGWLLSLAGSPVAIVHLFIR